MGAALFGVADLVKFAEQNDKLKISGAVDRYAQTVADQLRSWWRANPYLSGVHWTSGIELGVRLVSSGNVEHGVRLLRSVRPSLWPPSSCIGHARTASRSAMRTHLYRPTYAAGSMPSATRMPSWRLPPRGA